MLLKIVAQLKNGSIKNVVPFGSALPAAPYVVVKPEKLPYGRGFRIIAHAAKGGNILLENYAMDEVITLLHDFTESDRFGNRFTVKDTGEWTDVAAISDDSTISMERLFYAPMLTR
jgi:hypothetical protein